MKWLGSSDEIPDIAFPAFLQIMHQSFPRIAYSRESFNYARFSPEGQHPADPDAKHYPIRAREQGTIVGGDDVAGLFLFFEIDIQQFRDAFNAYYKLSPPASA